MRASLGEASWKAGLSTPRGMPTGCAHLIAAEARTQWLKAPELSVRSHPPGVAGQRQEEPEH